MASTNNEKRDFNQLDNEERKFRDSKVAKKAHAVPYKRDKRDPMKHFDLEENYDDGQG